MRAWRIGGSDLGRYVFGVATFATGLITLAWHDDNLYAVAFAQIFGGAAIGLPRTAKAGAVVLGAVYLVLALLCVPRIIAAPQVYDRWGNFFEPFSLATGAAIVYARLSSTWAAERSGRIGRTLFGICTISFTIEQAIHLDVTAQLVPKWVPPSQMFWALATTVAFALAAAALLTNRHFSQPAF